MGSMRDFMNKAKQKREQVTSTPVPASTPVGKDKPKKTSKDHEEANPNDVVTRSCGCKTGVLYLQGSPCPGCLKKKRAEAKRRNQENRNSKLLKDRLPDEAHFSLDYDADTTTWTGFLTVGEHSFTASASGVVKLLSILDSLYRDSLRG